MPDNCLFCKIVRGEIPANKLYEDEEILAFHDINPEAPLHFLIIPKKHMAGPAAVQEEDQKIIGKIISKGSELAQENGCTDFRIVANNGVEAGQTVFHLHLHFIGGRKMTWPPG